MNTILNAMLDTRNDTMILVLLCLAVLRIYLEVVKFDFLALPLTRALGEERAARFHRTGLILSVGYFVLFAPGYLLG